jgi:hypothetical protein
MARLKYPRNPDELKEDLILSYPSSETLIRSIVDWDHLNSIDTLVSFIREDLGDPNTANLLANQRQPYRISIPFLLAESTFLLSFTGLTNGAAIIGDHASISYSIDPPNETETVAWGTSAGDDTYGTGDSPTDFTAGDEGQLYLTVTDEEKTVTISALIRYDFGTAPTIADGQSWTVDDDPISIDASASGANLTFTYTLQDAPEGLVIDENTGLIEGPVTEPGSGTVTVVPADQYGATYPDTFTWTASLRTAATAGAPLDMSFVGGVGGTQDLLANVTDNGNDLTYVSVDPALPAQVTVDNDGLLTAASGVTETADDSYTFTFEDSYGRELEVTGTLEITAGGAIELPEGIYPVTFTGQSLALGFYAGGTKSTVEYDGVMLDTGLHSERAVGVTGTRGTTIVSIDDSVGNKQYDSGEVAFADVLQEIVETEDGVAIASQGFTPFLHNVANGGTKAENLIGNSDSYKSFWFDLEVLPTVWSNAGETFSGKWAGVRRQGEADANGIPTDPGRFKGALIIEQAMRTSDLSRKFGQDVNYDMITYQLASHATYDVATPSISLALLDLCREDGLPIYLSNPFYHLLYDDDLHLLNGRAYRHAATVEALTAKRLHFDNVRLEPLAIRAAWTDGNNIVLRYGVEAGRSLTLDTTLVAARTNSGFELYESDGTTPITITGVTVTGSNEVTLSTGSARSAGEIVRYAYTPDVAGKSGPTEGPRGNLRDDTPLTYDIDYFDFEDNPLVETVNLYRWAAIDEFTVSGSSGEPAAWSADPHAVKSLSGIAAEYGLTGLFDLHTDEATSIVNHAGADGTMTGTATYNSKGTTFASGVYIDTGLAETDAFTIFAAIEWKDISGTNADVLVSPSGTGLIYIRFDDALRLKIQASGDNASADMDPSNFFRDIGTTCAFGFHEGGASTTAQLLAPRFTNEDIETGDYTGTRATPTGNWLIGNDDFEFYAIAIADSVLTYEQQARLFRDLTYHLRQRGVYL